MPWPLPNGPLPPRHREPNAAVYKDWYRSADMPWPFSCKWEDWEGVLLFRDNEVEEIYNIPFSIPERIEPITYIGPGVDPFGWFFVAGGRYYCYDMEEDVVFRCEREFASPHEFLSWDKELSGTEIRRRPSTEVSSSP
ncbi:hypothetical protein DFH09DRAFT_1093498 [Mycena vulgaris]|nr:hypothetical protein DFH09DRAFT_1093498 [Mycena vulgaris]